jgi:hypothetical protein
LALDAQGPRALETRGESRLALQLGASCRVLEIRREDHLALAWQLGRSASDRQDAQNDREHDGPDAQSGKARARDLRDLGGMHDGRSPKEAKELTESDG